MSLKPKKCGTRYYKIKGATPIKEIALFHSVTCRLSVNVSFPHFPDSGIPSIHVFSLDLLVILAPIDQFNDIPPISFYGLLQLQIRILTKTAPGLKFVICGQKTYKDQAKTLS